MLRRLIGLTLIISILMPLILGAMGYLVVRQIVGDIENAARGPLQRIDSRLNDIRATLDEARQAFDGLASLISSIAAKLGSVIQGLRRAIDNLSIRIPALSIPDIVFRFPAPIGRVRIPVPDIPGFELPGLRQVRDILSGMYAVFGDLTEAIRRIATLGSLPRELSDLAADVRGLVDDFRAIGERWLGVLTLIASVLGIWIAATYIALAYRWLSAGWSMLRGGPAA